MKILIIGGTGNISTPLTKSLLTKGHEMILFNYDKVTPDWLKGVKVITGDRTNLPDFKIEIESLGKFDCVIDMICYEPSDAENDIKIFKNRTEQFIFCSTVDVYPKTPSKYPVNEEVEISALESFQYGYKKVQCEKLLWAAHKRGDFQLTVIRPAFTYNTGWSPGVHSFGGQSYHLDRIRKGKPIILHGDGTSIWVATYREDTAGAFVGSVCNQRAYGQAYNVPGDEWMTHNHIWKTIARLMNAPEPDFVYIPSIFLAKMAPVEAEWCRENFMHNILFDNSKAKRDLGFKYTVSFEQGAKMCIDNLSQNNLIEDWSKYPFYDKIVDNWREFEKGLLKKF